MSNEKPRRVAILIPTYNGERYIDELFKSIAADSYPKEQLGIFVVDNASRDNTVHVLTVIAREAMPRWSPPGRDPARGGTIHVIQNKTNRYFAKAINQAADAAIRAGYEYLFLLNQDTVIEKNCITILVEALNGDEGVAVAQARMMLYPEVPPLKVGGDIINSLGNAIHYLGFGFSVGNGKRWPPPPPRLGEGWGEVPVDYTEPSWPITYASGGAMMVSAVIWKEFGGFDESLEMYHEDLDFGWRLALAGKKAVCVRDAVVYHKYIFSPAPYKYYFMERNRIIVLLTHYRLWTLLLIAPMAIVMELGMIAFSIKNGWWKEKFRSYRDAVRMFPEILKLRKKSLLLRKLSDRDILKLIESAITDQPVSNVILDRIANPILVLYYHFFRLLV